MHLALDYKRTAPNVSKLVFSSTNIRWILLRVELLATSKILFEVDLCIFHVVCRKKLFRRLWGVMAADEKSLLIKN